LVVWKLDQLGRSIREVIELVNALKDRDVGFRSLRESLDTTTPGDKLVFHVFASIAEFESDVTRERMMAGLEAARARDRKGGRKPVMDEKKITLAAKLMRPRDMSIAEICEAVSVSRATLYRNLHPSGRKRHELVNISGREQ
jgi:DNA invertase Pin-like site-specific DNA recombinase